MSALSTLSALSSKNQSLENKSGVKGCPLYLTIGQAARLYNLTPQTLRRWADTGKVSTAVSVGGHRRLSALSLRDVLGVSEEKEGVSNLGGKKIALLSRVSGHSRGSGFDTTTGTRKENGTDSDLERQSNRLRSYCREYYGVEGELYSDIGSGLNYSRPNFQKLIREVCENKVSKVLTTTKDRCCRWGWELFDSICKGHSVEWVVIEPDGDESLDEMGEEVCAVIQIYNSKKMGKRSGKRSACDLSAECIEQAINYKKSGYTLQHIVKLLRKDGFVMTNGRSESKPITIWVLSKVLDSNGNERMLEQVVEIDETEENNLVRWGKEHLEKTECIDDKVKMVDIRESYEKWCSQNEQVPVSVVMVGRHLKTLAGRRFVSNGFTKYTCLVLK